MDQDQTLSLSTRCDWTPGRYESNREHLLDELARIDLMVRMRVLQLRQTDTDQLDEFQGLYISEAEIDTLLASDRRGAPGGPIDHPKLHRMAEQLEEEAARIAARRAASIANGMDLRLLCLASSMGLSGFETDVLLICLAPELDLRYERLYAYLQNDVTKRWAGVDLALSLLCPSFEAKLEARRYFAPDAPLISWRLLRLEDPPGRQASLLAESLKVDERVVDYLLDSDDIDEGLSEFARVYDPPSPAKPILEGSVRYRLSQLARAPGHRGPIFFFQGGYGVGKQRMARAVCHDIGSRLLVADLACMLSGSMPFQTAVRLVLREAILQRAAVYWDHFDVLCADEPNSRCDMLLRALGATPSPTFLAGEQDWQPTGVLHDVPVIRVTFPVPGYGDRRRLWAACLSGRFPTEDGVDIDALANKFRFSGGQICDAVTTARNLALGRGAGQISMGDLYQACRAHSNQRLGRLARRVSPHYTWADIILPPGQLRQLKEIVNTLRYRPVVHEEWGFDRKLSLGKGVNILFAGPSGTGKTMAAEIMAGELALDLYQIDLSLVVSKYIGETEKNLSQIFREAETSNSILFFDEADALFGKRSEVRDAHDRFANIEIAYLLQKMEAHEGMVIMATNLRQNLDEAFVRRLQFIVEFPFPEEAYRRRIWEVTFPPEAPLAESVDLDFLARQFKLTGGSIRNVILGAAFLSADDGRVITMEHLIRATRREIQKMGKLVVEGDFGKYYDLLSSPSSWPSSSQE